MKCPYRMRAFDHPDTCDAECAWFLEYDSGPFTASDRRFGSCAIAVLAQSQNPGYGIRITGCETASLAGDEIGR